MKLRDRLSSTNLKEPRPQCIHKPLQSLIHPRKVTQAMVALGTADALLRPFSLNPFVIYAMPQVEKQLACRASMLLKLS